MTVSFGPPLLVATLYAAVLACAAWTDLRSRRIPNALTVPATILALTAAAWQGTGPSALGGAAVGASAFVLPMVLYGAASAGGGDVKLAAFLGAMLGLDGVLGALLVAGIAASVVVITGIAARRIRWDTRIPFGPFLAIGGLAALLLG